MTIPTSSLAARIGTASALAIALCVPQTAQARARTHVSPYLEVDQTVIADIKGGSGDVLTYSSVAVGVDASVQTQRAEATIDLRYEHQFGWNKHSADSDLISGIASARYQITPQTLSIEGGALATRVRTDGFTGANGSLASAGSNHTNVYSLYAGPTLTTHVGELSVNAAYRLGYSRVEDDVSVTLPGGPALDSFGDSTFHSITASVGMQPGHLPFGWTLSAGYDREDASQLDQRYEDKWARADVTVPVSRTVAAVGGVGYEAIKISARDALRDGLGNPVVDGGGRFVTDPASPRMLAYDSDGLIWDVGVLWRPSRRTSLEARIGHRYGGMQYFGSFAWTPDSRSSFGVAVYSSIDSFGRALLHNLDGLPGSFTAHRNPFSGDLTGCVQGDQSGGQCFNDTLSGITTANYRHRGISAQYARNAGPLNWGVGLGYSQRKFLVPNSGVLAALNGTKDENYYGDVFAGYAIDPVSTLQGDVYVNVFNAGVTGFDVTNIGSYVTYTRTFGQRLSANASLGIDSVKAQDIEAIISALGQVGLRYQF